jgi:hypothetical protein
MASVRQVMTGTLETCPTARIPFAEFCGSSTMGVSPLDLPDSESEP